MKIGMLWFDNDKQTDLATKIQHAADYYQNKYGLRPNLCYVHPTMTPKSNDGENEEKKEEKVLKAGSVRWAMNTSRPRSASTRPVLMASSTSNK